jgi:hypothetical protein
MIRVLIFLAGLLALIPTQAQAQAPVLVYCDTGVSGANRYIPCNTTYPLAVSASVTASISGFTATSTGTPISVTTGGVTGTLPSGTVVVATNAGATNTAYCALGGSATTSSQPISPGGWFAFTVGVSTQLTCITSTSTTTVNMTGGAGLPTGTGGGGSGGSGGAVTIASAGVASGAYASGSIASGAIVSGADVTEGTTAETTVYAGSGGCTVVACLKGIYSGVTGAIPAGTALIGKVGIDQTTPGTTNGVQVNAALPAGSNVIGGVTVSAQADPCFASAKTNLAINGNSTSSTQLIALSGSTTIYICSLSLIAAGATTVAFTTGTGTACVTNNAAVIGSTTANIANSISLAANGGLTLGSGVGTIAKGVASSEFCMILGSSVYVAGNLTYVQQ